MSTLSQLGVPRLRLLVLTATMAACALTPAQAPAAQIFVTAEADAYTSAAAPTTNYGTINWMHATPIPLQANYVRFKVQNLTGQVTKATLQLYSRTSSSEGLSIYTVSNAWDERTITHQLRPTIPATAFATTGAITEWVRNYADVTSAVSGNGTISLALLARSSTDVRLASQEAGVNAAARLIIDTSEVTGPPPPPPPPPPPGSVLPYDVASPWNTPIPSVVAQDPKSATYINAIVDNDLPLTSDPDQYTIPVYYFDDQTPLRTVALGGYYSTYDAGDNSRVGYGQAPTISGIPIPDSATASAGTDEQIVIWNPTSGVQYTFLQFAKNARGNYTATNGNRYHTTAGYYGRFADGMTGRGAGMPYLAGLVRPWEIEQGHIDHALAFAYGSPSSAFVWPASKSDGVGFLGTDVPEGARLQLDPTLTDADFTALGLSAPAKVIAKALQQYGMYVVDNGGSSKIYLEDRITAGWDSSITRNLVSNIPLAKFRVVAAPAAPG